MLYLSKQWEESAKVNKTELKITGDSLSQAKVE